MRSRYTFKSSIPIAPQKIAIRDRLRKKGITKSLGEELCTLSDLRDHSRNFIFSFEKLYKTPGLTVELKRKKYEHSMIPF